MKKNITQFLITTLTFSLLFLLLPNISNAQTCGGNIIRGCSGTACFLDPDGDGDIIASGTGFTNCGTFVDEMLEFEDLRNPTGCVSCQRPWVAIPGLQETTHDLWAGGAGCGNTEVVPVDASDPTYAYYTIIDPDGICDNGDELLIFRIRIAASANGSFSYSLMVDTDNLLGANDPDGVQCASKVANAGFEYEIIANPGNNKTIDVVDVNGQAGTGTVVQSYDNDVYYNQANACRSACGCNSGAVYHTFAIELTAIGKSCADKGFRFAGGTASSGNGTLSSNTSIADFGGASAKPSCPDTTVICNCCEECADVTSAYYCGGNQTTCLMACIGACVAEENGEKTDLPVEFTSFDGYLESNQVNLKWIIATELNNDFYVIERSHDGSNFESIGQLDGVGTTTVTQYYNWEDINPQNGVNYYRIKQVDFDGQFSYSKSIAIEFNQQEHATLYPTIVRDLATILLNVPEENIAAIQVVDINGRPARSFVRPIQKGLNKIEFNTNNLAKGVYFVRIDYNGISNMLKFIKG